MKLAAAALAAALAATLLPATGCIGLCGAYSGGDDRMLRRGDDSLLLCSNDGFVATIGGTIIEGKYLPGAQASTATGSGSAGTGSGSGAADAEQVGTGFRGSDGALAFDLYAHANATYTAPQLGAGAFAMVELDKVALNYADTNCKDLETRAWWTP